MARGLGFPSTPRAMIMTVVIVALAVAVIFRIPQLRGFVTGGA